MHLPDKSNSPATLFDHLKYQEEVLQGTRNIHYLLQALMLAIAVALYVVQLTLVLDPQITENGLLTEFKRLNGNAVGAILNFWLVCIYSWLGLGFLRVHSERVKTRGLIIDFLQHLKILEEIDHFKIVAETLFNRQGFDTVYLAVKVCERIAKKGLGFFETGKSSSEVASLIDELSEQFQLRNPNLWRFLLFKNRIQKTDYLKYLEGGNLSRDFDEISKELGPRKISSFRSGDTETFELLWLALGAATVLTTFAQLFF